MDIRAPFSCNCVHGPNTEPCGLGEDAWRMLRTCDMNSASADTMCSRSTVTVLFQR